MTNERLLCDADVRSVIRLPTPVADKGLIKSAVVSGVSDQGSVTMEKTLKKDSSMSAVERILDSLKLSPKWRRQSPENEKKRRNVEETRIAANANSRLTNQHLSLDNRKHATISTSSSDYPETETYDSFSDSTYSQSSETSVNSDGRSLNTTSTDSDNNRLFQQGTSPRSRILSKGDSEVIEDEGYLRRVLMLMKVVLYLRHSFPLKFVRRRKVFPAENRRNKLELHDSPSLSSSSMDSQDSSEFSGKSPRSRKRISFSPTTLLFSAITEKAYLEARTILEEQDLDVNSQTPNGQTLLHIAAANADLKCVQLLIQYGADVNMKDANGWTPLHTAVRRGNWKSAILLIEAGADFGEYAQARIQEYNQVLQMSSTFYRSVEIFV